jgi:hypothetical protein
MTKERHTIHRHKKPKAGLRLCPKIEQQKEQAVQSIGATLNRMQCSHQNKLNITMNRRTGWGGLALRRRVINAFDVARPGEEAWNYDKGD